jgi:RimJ/RimL family protein N-acetyltransferase
MVGDVNLFLTPHEDDHQPGLRAECEVMVAESAYHRRGLATAALVMTIRYAAAQVASPLSFFCRIGLSNEASLALFEKRLGFVRHKVVEVFQEVELRLPSVGLLPNVPFSTEKYDKSA